MQEDVRAVSQGEHERRVLISGGSFAGLATAWWLHQLGYQVTVIEAAASLRKGGTPVDIRESIVEVAQRMGLLDQIIANSLPGRPTSFLDIDGRPMTQAAGQPHGEHDAHPGWEIERDTLLELLFDRVKDSVEVIFGDRIAHVEETPQEVHITFASGEQRTFALLLGCDGTHSAVRSMCFGDESTFVFFLKNYFSLTIVNKLLLPENTAQMYSVPGKTVMVNAYNGKTDIAFGFSSAEEMPYDRRDIEAQKQTIRDHFRLGGWRTEELLGEMSRCDDFYFDKLCQVRMPAWTRGRVALVGDAGYCPSPAAGMGGSMALLGATALADALRKYPDDYAAAFQEYDQSLRPIVEEIQANAVEFGVKMFLPVSSEELHQRNELMNLR